MTDEELHDNIRDQIDELIAGNPKPGQIVLLVQPAGVDDEQWFRVATQFGELKPAMQN